MKNFGEFFLIHLKFKVSHDISQKIRNTENSLDKNSDSYLFQSRKLSRRSPSKKTECNVVFAVIF